MVQVLLASMSVHGGLEDWVEITEPHILSTYCVGDLPHQPLPLDFLHSRQAARGWDARDSRGPRGSSDSPPTRDSRGRSGDFQLVDEGCRGGLSHSWQVQCLRLQLLPETFQELQEPRLCHDSGLAFLPLSPGARRAELSQSGDISKAHPRATLQFQRVQVGWRLAGSPGRRRMSWLGCGSPPFVPTEVRATSTSPKFDLRAKGRAHKNQPSSPRPGLQGRQTRPTTRRRTPATSAGCLAGLAGPCGSVNNK